jgi:alginate O-acetyltransferase complex protein AlgI
MFPQLVAGPIIRASDFLKQLSSYRIPNHLEKWNALKIICYGLFQKVVIADNLSYFIDSAYQNKSAFNGSIYWWMVAIAFSIQIYADFSGYSLIARGIAKMMGYHFKMNFNHPYLATSIRQFWNRWHISLSTWFRDYVYIPLGGSRKGIYFGYYVLTVTMLLSGIWHGANYTFIIWALLHTLFLIIERRTKWTSKLKNLRLLALLIVFVQVTIAWVFFRASTINQAGGIIKTLFTFQPSNFDFFDVYYNELIFLYLAIIIEAIIYLRKEKKSFRHFYKHHQQVIDILLITLCIIAILFFRGEGQQFIYFQF